VNPRLQSFLSLAALAGLVAGGILGVIGWQQRTIASLGRPEPQTIRLADLAGNGPGDNVHVTVTDFTLGERYVAETKRGRWNRVWVPLFPARSAQKPGEVRVVVKSFKIPDEEALRQLYQQAKLTGVITNSIHSLGSKEIKELEQGYPGADFASALVVEEGREFPRQQKVFLTLGGAAALILVGVVCGVALLVAKRRAAG
jgi:hypothetical protein